MVIEGIFPFLAPKAWREAMVMVVKFDNRSLRIMGLSSMLIGTGLLYVIH